MDLDFNWISLLILFGAVQGLIFSVILFFDKKHPGAKFLSAFMLVLAYNGLETFAWSSGLSDYTLVFDVFPFVLIYALGPSLYTYLLSLLNPQKRLSKKKLLIYYSPFLFQFLVTALLWVSYLFVLLEEYASSRHIIEVMYSVLQFYSEPLSVIVFIFFMVKSVKLYLKIEGDHLISMVSKEKKKLLFGWAFTLLVCLAVFAVIWLIIVVVPLFIDVSDETKYYPIEVGLVVFIYWIAFAGYHKMKLIDPAMMNKESKSVSGDEAESHMDQLRHAMENEKLYLDTKLNRQKVADHLNIDPKKVSAILNQYANQSFSAFVNGYRIEEASRKMLSKEHDHLTISGIALESGFNSQATFQRAFKSIHGQTPRAFLKQKKGEIIILKSGFE